MQTRLCSEWPPFKRVGFFRFVLFPFSEDFVIPFFFPLFPFLSILQQWSIGSPADREVGGWGLCVVNFPDTGSFPCRLNIWVRLCLSCSLLRISPSWSHIVKFPYWWPRTCLNLHHYLPHTCEIVMTLLTLMSWAPCHRAPCQCKYSPIVPMWHKSIL